MRLSLFELISEDAHGPQVFERESKTKAFSKEGLARAERRNAEDPEEQTKDQARDILNDYILRLTEQVD